MADELDWLELLVASERIEKWLSTLCQTQNSLSTRRQAMQQMAEAVMEREAYAEEARQAGAVSRLTKVLATTEDLVLKQALVKFCTHLELTSAFMHKSSTINYGDLSVNIKEGPLGDGLGARVWVVAHTLCRELVEHPGIIAGKSVLEIGSGCGLCGIVAAKLGAAQVMLTDNEDKVLFNLRDCVAINSNTSSPHAAMELPSSPTRAASLSPHDMSAPAEATSDRHVAAATAQSGQCQDSVPALVQHRAAADDCNVADADEPYESLLDPEDADSCDDLDGFFKHANPHAVAARDTTSWDHGNMHVRYLDWAEAMAMEVAQTAQNKDSSNVVAAAANHAAADSSSQQQAKTIAPHVQADETFDVIIGTDIMYEAPHPSLVAAVLRQRLSLAGQAVICCAVRDQASLRPLSRHCPLCLS
ncbi:MAG: hypothetical protein FRX49_10727 [Trebouxia sp. A1-2]|nr:MAG: hypothetical protein FRX49_10727 [Trebouxia sp. A1-2]